MSNLSTTDKTIDIATCGDTREGVPSHGANPEVLESSSEEGEIREDPESGLSEDEKIREDPKSGKRRHSPDEQTATKRIKGPGPDALKFSDMFHVRTRLNCIISVNDLGPFGNLETTTEGWMIRMFMDPGWYGPPTITLGFSKDGGREQWRSTWDVESYVRGEWAMDELTFARISDRDPLNFDHYDYRAMMACGTKLDKTSLMSMKFRSWAKVINFDSLSTLPPQKESIQFPKSSRASMKAIFCPEESYMLTIWFIAPHDVIKFQQNCLGVYTRALAARRPPLYRFKDDSGAKFSTWRAPSLRKSKAVGEDQQILAPEASAAFDLGAEGESEGSMSSGGDKMEVQSIKQYPHPVLQARQPISGVGPGLTNESPIYERDMEVHRWPVIPAYLPPLQAESRRASVERGSKTAPEISRARSDISPVRRIGSDSGLHPDAPLDLLEPEDSNVMDQAGTPIGTNLRLDRFPESPSSPENGSGSLMAYHGSATAPLELGTRPKGSANPDDQTELTLTTERSPSPSAPEETNDNSSFSFLREDSAPPPREYGAAVPSFLFGPLQADEKSEEGNSDGSEE